MKSVIKIPAGYSLHGLAPFNGSGIKQYELHGNTLRVWSTGLGICLLTLSNGESIREYMISSEEVEVTP